MPQMRKIFGNGTVMEGACFGAAFLRFGGVVVELLPSLGGQPVPDLSCFVGSPIMFSGELSTPNGTISTATCHWGSLAQAPELLETPACATITGNAGSAAEVARDGNRASLSLAYANRGRGDEQETSWIKVNATRFLDTFAQLQEVTAGARLICSGALESYTYEGTGYLRLVAYGISLNGPAVASTMPAMTGIATASGQPLGEVAF